MVLFVGPAVDASTEVLQVFFTWDVQRRGDDTAIAVHPFRDDWIYEDDFQTYRSQLEMELPAFTQAVATANQTRVTEYGGRIAPSNFDKKAEGVEIPTLVTDANRLRDYYTAIGACSHPDGPPAPPCGLAVPGQTYNPGLMRDC